jgi:glycosyltransferase involved in cell wall biosynthesis
MAEAMSVGTPVIATAYSGNLDFMPDGSALLVPSRGLVPVGAGSIYPPEGRWADPDLDVAAEMMARVRDDAHLRGSLSHAGRAALEPFGAEQVGAAVRRRLERIWRDR